MSFSSWLNSCAVPQRSLAITLDETPLYSEEQWAVVNMPYIKVSQGIAVSQRNALLGMVRFGNIVEVQRIEKSLQDSAMWAFILWKPQNDQQISKLEQPERLTNGSGVSEKQNQENDGAQIQGWVPYGFLHIVSNFKEAQLVSHQMLIPKGIVINTKSQPLSR